MSTVSGSELAAPHSDPCDARLRAWSILALRLSLAIVYIWFGALKPLGQCPIADLVSRTIFWFPQSYVVPTLGWVEIGIGIGLLVPRCLKFSLALLFLQLFGTMMPLFMFPNTCFSSFPVGLTLEGQYIVKNIVLFAASLAVLTNSLPSPKP